MKVTAAALLVASASAQLPGFDMNKFCEAFQKLSAVTLECTAPLLELEANPKCTQLSEDFNAASDLTEGLKSMDEAGEMCKSINGRRLLSTEDPAAITRRLLDANRDVNRALMSLPENMDTPKLDELCSPDGCLSDFFTKTTGALDCMATKLKPVVMEVMEDMGMPADAVEAGMEGFSEETMDLVADAMKAGMEVMCSKNRGGEYCLLKAENAATMAMDEGMCSAAGAMGCCLTTMLELSTLGDSSALDKTKSDFEAACGTSGLPPKCLTQGMKRDENIIVFKVKGAVFDKFTALSDDKKEKIRWAMIKDAAKALEVDPSRIEITDVKGDSDGVKVTISVVSSEGKTPAEIAAKAKDVSIDFTETNTEMQAADATMIASPLTSVLVSEATETVEGAGVELIEGTSGAASLMPALWIGAGAASVALFL